MTFEQAVEAAYQAWKASAVGVSFGDANYCFDTEPFKPATGSIWAQITVRYVSSEQLTLGAAGNRQYRDLAAMFVTIRGPRAGGRMLLDRKVDLVRAEFRGRRFGELSFMTPRAPSVVRSTQWLGIVLPCPFDYHQTA